MDEGVGGEEKISDRVMILFMGGSHEHAITSIQHFVPDAVHIITSDKYDKVYRRRLREWSQKYKFRRGTVQAVSDLFEPSSVSSLIGCAWSVAGHEHNLFEGKIETWKWNIGITGGTMHMAAVASLVAGVLDAHAFYVIKPEEGGAVMPNRDVIMLPGIHALKMAMALNPLDLDFMMSDDTGDLDILLEKTSVEPWMIDLMETSLLVETHPTEPKWRMTPMGGKLLTMLRNGPLQTMLTMEEMARLKEIQDSRQETIYHG
jgi:hypothetical protein